MIKKTEQGRIKSIQQRFYLDLDRSMRGMRDHLGGDASDIQAGATEGSPTLNAGGLEPQLGSLDGSDISTGASSDDNHVLLLARCSGKRSGEPEQIGLLLSATPLRLREANAKDLHLPECNRLLIAIKPYNH